MKGFEKREDLSFGGKEIGSVEKEFLFFIFFRSEERRVGKECRP